MSNAAQVLIDGRMQDVKVNGSDQDYAAVRNIVISSGRFMDLGTSRGGKKWRCSPTIWRSGCMVRARPP